MIPNGDAFCQINVRYHILGKESLLETGIIQWYISIVMDETDILAGFHIGNENFSPISKFALLFLIIIICYWNDLARNSPQSLVFSNDFKTK